MDLACGRGLWGTCEAEANEIRGTMLERNMPTPVVWVSEELHPLSCGSSSKSTRIRVAPRLGCSRCKLYARSATFGSKLLNLKELPDAYPRDVSFLLLGLVRPATICVRSQWYNPLLLLNQLIAFQLAYRSKSLLVGQLLKGHGVS